jgi:hypothetical protein
MKKYFGAILVALGLLVLSGCIMYTPGTYGGPYDQPQEPYDQPQEPYNPGYSSGSNLDISYFYDYLSDYGQWVYYPGYNYVWVPYNMAPAWRPYSYGRWVWTEYGWTWVSTFRWGWIPFHYGRWVFEPGFGWFWIPDTVWGPAWVSWRYGGSYIGWAPLPPRYRYDHGRGLFLSSIDLPDDCWVFVDSRHFDARDIHGYVLPWNRNRDYIRTTVTKTQLEERGGRIINNGLDLNEAQRITGHGFSKFVVQDSNAPQAARLSSDRVVIYKPRVTAKSSAAPKKFVKKDEAATAKKSTPVRKVKRDEEASAGGVQTGKTVEPTAQASSGFLSSNGAGRNSATTMTRPKTQEVRTAPPAYGTYVAPKAEVPKAVSTIKPAVSAPRPSVSVASSSTAAVRVADSTSSWLSVAPKVDQPKSVFETGRAGSIQSPNVKGTAGIDPGTSVKSVAANRTAAVKEAKGARTVEKSSASDKKSSGDSGQAKAKGRNAR